MLDGFYKLPATKALAPNGFPAIVWKAIAHDLTPILYKSLYDHYCRQNPLPPEHWSAGWLHLLAKPGKACNRPEALRPICLQHPVSKVVSGILTQRVMDSAYPQLRQLPLYAYLPGRSTADCLLLTSAHCRAVREACQQTRQNLDRHNLIGGLQVSLDMEKAFDTISRNVVDGALAILSLHPDVLTMIHAWLAPNQYYIPFKDLVGHLITTRGIQQGSKAAPLLWSLYMHLLMVDLLARYSHTWLHEHLIVFADDVHLRWIIRNHEDSLQALTDLSFVLTLMKSYGLRINVQKSVALCRIIGRSAPAFLRKWTVRSKEGPRLTIPDLDWKLPLVSKTAYLGVVISYRAWEMDTTKRRIAAIQHCFHVLRRWFTDTTIPKPLKFRLYKQCILLTLQYSIFEMGVTQQGFKQLISVINIHLRRMIREPIHVTHESTHDCFHRHGLDPPWIILQNTFARLNTALHSRRNTLSGDMANQNHDICACALTPDYPDQELIPPTDPQLQITPDSTLKCPECLRCFQQAGSLKRHLRQQPGYACLMEDIFNCLRDAHDGTSTCSHCHHHVANMRTLREHINSFSCSCFRATKGAVIPIAARPELRMHLRHRSYQGLILDQNLTVELANRCAYCNQQIGPRAIAKHYSDQHPDLMQYSTVHKDRVRWAANFGSRKNTCPLRRTQTQKFESHACGALFQLTIMAG